MSKKNLAFILAIPVLFFVIFTQRYGFSFSPRPEKIDGLGTPQQAASSTEIVASSTSSVATSTTASSSIAVSKPKTNSPTQPSPTTTVSTGSPALNTGTVSVEPPVDFEKINTDSRKAVINIFCMTKGSALSPISGTGVIVGAQGLVLTNAHIAQYFLLKDYPEKNFVECIGRTGSPAYPTYRLELVYISPQWIAENKTQVKEQNPKGTGEYDYAFLRIIGKVDNSPLGTTSFIPMDIREDINKDEPVLLASYPAGFLSGLSIIKDLYITTAVTTIAELYTFRDGTADVISVPGTVVSQKGSSGGAVVDKRTHLIGLISTSSGEATTAERDLQAITSAYINRDMQKNLGISLAQFVYTNHEEFAQSFASTTASNLAQIIIDELNR